MTATDQSISWQISAPEIAVNYECCYMPLLDRIARFLSLSLTLLVVKDAQACKGFQEPEIQSLVKDAQKLSALLSDDLNYLKVQKFSGELQKSRNFKSAMQPLELDSEELNTFGKVVAAPAFNANVKFEGTGVKIGNQCIVTAAHVLYPITEQELSENNRAKYSGTIRFVRMAGEKAISQKASIFFQMTKELKDFEIDGHKRHFKGYSDIVILRLDGADEFKNEISIQRPKELLKDVDGRIGKKITCIGLPSHMTEQKFGNCSGDLFLWKHENARIFAEDKTVNDFGIVTNAAFSGGMSGGGCFLAEDKSKKLIGIAVSGYDADSGGTLVMPDIEFVNQEYKEKYARHIATFHELDNRMKKELGHGLDQLDKYCQ